jgi:hypothetical protein
MSLLPLQALILEHAQAVSPAFALVRKTLELGWGPGGPAADEAPAAVGAAPAHVELLVRKKLEPGYVGITSKPHVHLQCLLCAGRAIAFANKGASM